MSDAKNFAFLHGMTVEQLQGCVEWLEEALAITKTMLIARKIYAAKPQGLQLPDFFAQFVGQPVSETPAQVTPPRVMPAPVVTVPENERAPFTPETWEVRNYSYDVEPQPGSPRSRFADLMRQHPEGLRLFDVRKSLKVSGAEANKLARAAFDQSLVTYDPETRRFHWVGGDKMLMARFERPPRRLRVTPVDEEQLADSAYRSAGIG